MAQMAAISTPIVDPEALMKYSRNSLQRSRPFLYSYSLQPGLLQLNLGIWTSRARGGITVEISYWGYCIYCI